LVKPYKLGKREFMELNSNLNRQVYEKKLTR
jgi:hypothetical protein